MQFTKSIPYIDKGEKANLVREILFRGKREYDGKWIEGSLLKYSDGTAFICCENHVPNVLNKYSVYPDTVGQYTGLNDKNDVKIFEGDIVRTPYYEFEVCFKGGCFGGIFKEVGFSVMAESIYGVSGEIIGNIHDNPELLESEESNNETKS